MAKVSGSYESVIRGVSQQVPQDRRSGQHKEQINMLSDPVRGLCRRHGSLMVDEVPVSGVASFAALLSDTLDHKTYTVTLEGIEYDIIYRTNRNRATADSAGLWAFNKTTDQFIPVVTSGSATVHSLLSGGISAMTSVGRYVYMAGYEVVPTYSTVDHHTPQANKQKVAAWVRGGAYSRTFKVKLTLSDGTKVTGSYKTVSASYPTLLDTSDILSNDPDYQKKVNDRVYAYNSQVTKWIGLAAEDITPENIASLVGQSLTNAGIVGVTVQGGTVCIDDPRVVDATGEDGGDGALLRVVAQEVTAPELVSTVHWAGKVVKVKPQRSREDDAFYLKAVPKDPAAIGFTEVAWKECAGVEYTPQFAFCMATVDDGTLYLGDGPTDLSSLTGLVVPGFSPNAVGDGLTSPLPAFFGKVVTFLGTFQDRLIIGAGSTIFGTRPGDYLNFFRQSVLTVLDSDPFEIYALGAEDDVIYHGASFDRDLILFGRKYQYALAGRTPMTPKTASVTVASAYKDAIDAAPKEGGNFVFYGKYSKDPVTGIYKTSLHQIGQGSIAEAPESFEVSQALDDYIGGRPVEIVTYAAPNMVMLRTDELRYGLYAYTYLDTPDGGQRLFDAWHSWIWNEQVGAVVGMSPNNNGINAYMVRQRDGIIYIACERFSFNTTLSTAPYADSLQPLAEAEANPAMYAVQDAIVALSQESNKPLMGAFFDDVAAFKAAYPTELSHAWVGIAYDAYVTPTNPFTRDQNGKAMMGGRFTLSQVTVSVADTAGMVAEVSTPNGISTALDFNGRVLGRQTPPIPGQPIVSTNLSFTVGKEVRAVEYTLSARSWLPLTITNIEWTGQVFNNTRRVT